MQTPDGKTYYWNKKTGIVSWDPPSGGAAAASSSEDQSIARTYSHTGVEGRSYSGAKRDMASLVFKKFNTDHSGVFSDADWKGLCKEMEHEVDDDHLKLVQRLLDVNGDGMLHRDEFALWWKEGDHRWEVFQMSKEQMARVSSSAIIRTPHPLREHHLRCPSLSLFDTACCVCC